MKVALVYDRINKFGGAERVLLALHEIWPDAPLYTSVYDKKLTPWADHIDVKTSFLQKLPLPKNKHEYYPFLMGPAFETLVFDEFDVVISVTSEFCKAIVTKPKTLHVCYCLTPTGYLWSGYKDYYSSHHQLLVLTGQLINYLRFYDKIIANRPDNYIAISKTVQERIKKYYGQSSNIIYPPVNLGNISSSGDFFLIVSRLVAHKQIAIAVKAFNRLELPLVIIGTGEEEKSLRRLAKPNIKFIGNLTDEELARYYRTCRAVVIPGVEDFNIVAVEAQSFGKPVIAYGVGGVTETVIENKTGWFFKEHNSQSLIDLISKINWKNFDSRDCQINARRFSKERFKKEFKTYIEKTYRQYVRQS